MFAKSNYKTSEIPQKSGVYVFRNQFYQVIYIGKAKNLRKRLSSYFQMARSKTSNVKLATLIANISFFDYIIVKNEKESLLLESQLIKKYQPKYNILLRDDKQFLLIKINLYNDFPRLELTRQKYKDKACYFGPFPRTSALRGTIDFLNIHFKLRSCKKEVLSVEDKLHCHEQVLSYCSAPCTNDISQENYRKKIDKLMEVLTGKTQEMQKLLQTKMQDASCKEEYEKAALYRDMIDNLRYLFSQNKIFSNADIGSGNMLAVQQLQEDLQLKSLPYIIECFDNSHFQGSFLVSSMVRFKNGTPDKSNYRTYRLSHNKIDDYISMYEVVSRRYTRLKNEQKELPDLIVIDGGKGQLNIANKALQDVNLTIPIISLAKEQEEVFILGEKTSIKIDHHKSSLQLLQYLRDESHRFAIQYNRKLRQKNLQKSKLDNIPSIGKKRKEKLLQEFQSIANIKKSNIETICKKVPSIGKNLAQKILDNL